MEESGVLSWGCSLNNLNNWKNQECLSGMGIAEREKIKGGELPHLPEIFGEV